MLLSFASIAPAAVTRWPAATNPVAHPPTPPLQLHFQRYECKYVIADEVAQRVRRFVAPFVRPDPYVEGRADYRYRISSLYLDTPDLRLYRETLEGQSRRFKLRVRAYSDDPRAPVFAEIKKRFNGVVRKVRSPIPRSQFVSLIETGEIDVAGAPPAESAAVEEFRAKAIAIGARPIVQVGYAREAWVGRHDPTVRVTFDRSLMARATDTATLSMTGPQWDLIEGSRVVLEMKFNDRCPGWMRDAIRSLGLFRQSYSKYSHALLAARVSLATSMGLAVSAAMIGA